MRHIPIRDVVATISEFDPSRPRGRGDVIGTYLLGVADDVSEEDIEEAVLEDALRSGVLHPDQLDEVVCASRSADPVVDAHLLAGRDDETVRGETIH